MENFLRSKEYCRFEEDGISVTTEGTVLIEGQRNLLED